MHLVQLFCIFQWQLKIVGQMFTNWKNASVFNIQYKQQSIKTQSELQMKIRLSGNCFASIFRPKALSQNGFLNAKCVYNDIPVVELLIGFVR